MIYLNQQSSQFKCDWNAIFSTNRQTNFPSIALEHAPIAWHLKTIHKPTYKYYLGPQSQLHACMTFFFLSFFLSLVLISLQSFDLVLKNERKRTTTEWNTDPTCNEVRENGRVVVQCACSTNLCNFQPGLKTGNHPHLTLLLVLGLGSI